MVLLPAVGGIAMEDAVAQTVKFLAAHCNEIVALEKTTLEGVLKSSGAKRVAAWKTAQNFWVRKFASFNAAQVSLFEDWEFVLCDMSGLDAATAAARLGRCVDRAEEFLNEHGAALKKLGAKSLVSALNSRHMKQFDLSAFTGLLLQRRDLTREQREVFDYLETRVCVLTPEQQQLVRQRVAHNFEALVEFLAEAAEEIIGLKKATLRDVAMSFRNKQSVKWKHMGNFFMRHVVSLTVEQKQLLDDWELVLCLVDVSDTAVLLPGIRRSFDRVAEYIEENKQELINLHARTLDTALSNKRLRKDSFCVFSRWFLQRYAEQLPLELKLQVDHWEQTICGVAAGEAAAEREQRMAYSFEALVEFLAETAEEIIGLKKATLRDVAMSFRKTHSVKWKHMDNFFMRHVVSLTVEQKQLLDDWELVLCLVDVSDTAVLVPGIRRSFDRVAEYIEENKQTLINLHARTLDTALSNKRLGKESFCVFSRCFLLRYAEQLPLELKLQVDHWEQTICGVAAGEAAAEREQQMEYNFDFLLQFFADFAEEIISLKKATLIDVLNSNLRNQHLQWFNARNFLVRHVGKLTAAQREVIDDWELVLCFVDMSNTAALLPGLRRCFGRVSPEPRIHPN